MRRVILESPFGSPSAQRIQANILYARACVRDCLNYGESAYASHLFFTQEGILRDEIPEERKLGIEAGFAWHDAAEYSVMYIDRGLSKGMQEGLENAKSIGKTIVKRQLRDPETKPQITVTELAGHARIEVSLDVGTVKGFAAPGGSEIFEEWVSNSEAALSVLGDSVPNGRIAVIDHLLIKPMWRFAGFGTVLLRTFVGAAKANTVLMPVPQGHDGIDYVQFLEKSGFRTIGERHNSGVVLMALELDPEAVSLADALKAAA